MTSTPRQSDPFDTRDTFDTGSGPAGIYRLSRLEDAGLTNLAALGHVSTEMHYQDYSLVSCQFTNKSAYFPAADPVNFYASMWDGTLTWSTSYWR